MTDSLDASHCVYRLPSAGVTITLRRRTQEDDAAIVSLYSDQERDTQPLSVESFGAACAEQARRGSGEDWVAADSGPVVGWGGFEQAWWTGDPGVYSLHLRVTQRYRGQGLGSALYALLVRRLQDRAASRGLVWVRSDDSPGLRFARKSGWLPTRQEIGEYRLHVPDATTDRYSGLEATLAASGIRIATLAEVGANDERLLRGLHHISRDSDASSDPAEREEAFRAWRSATIDAPGLAPETHWVALQGDAPVGLTFLKQLNAEAAENDFTVVATTHRGRGIAQALKVRAIEWARTHGVRWFYTSSEVGNAPMIAINRSLGYQPGARRVEMTGEIPAALTREASR